MTYGYREWGPPPIHPAPYAVPWLEFLVDILKRGDQACLRAPLIPLGCPLLLLPVLSRDGFRGLSRCALALQVVPELCYLFIFSSSSCFVFLITWVVWLIFGSWSLQLFNAGSLFPHSSSLPFIFSLLSHSFFFFLSPLPFLPPSFLLALLPFILCLPFIYTWPLHPSSLSIAGARFLHTSISQSKGNENYLMKL